ncbi:NAD-dependent deacylase [bacterium]|nr:MAG: NAD-dependent deacylase [bacterium]
MKKIVALTGSGISKESGLSTFRDHDGLWEGYNVHEVASIDGWYANPQKVLDFYNQRRIQAFNAQPNRAHSELAKIESEYEVCIITQNVDDLHEKAGSTHVIHLHGSLFEAYPENHPTEIIHIGDKEIHFGDKAENGFQLRPNIVWFGEMVPKMEEAIFEVLSADVFVVIGTSLLVYPAASLLHYVQKKVPVYIVDPVIPPVAERNSSFIFIQEDASIGVPIFIDQLRNEVK